MRMGQAAAESDGGPAVGDVKGLALKQGMRGLAVFSEPGAYTWQRPEGCRNVYVRICGGGGGSGGVPATGSGQFSSSAGGGAGYAEKFIADVAGEVAVQVGQGGSAGSLGTGNGGDGGESRFGDYVSATGGTGSSKGYAVPFGQVSSAMESGKPGVGINGDLNLDGGFGVRTIAFTHNTGFEQGSGGVCAMFGGALQTLRGYKVNPGNGAIGRAQLNQNDSALAGYTGGHGCVMVYAF